MYFVRWRLSRVNALLGRATCWGYRINATHSHPLIANATIPNQTKSFYALKASNDFNHFAIFRRFGNRSGQVTNYSRNHLFTGHSNIVEVVEIRVRRERTGSAWGSTLLCRAGAIVDSRFGRRCRTGDWPAVAFSSLTHPSTAACG
jgi:hypothetical protein